VARSGRSILLVVLANHEQIWHAALRAQNAVQVEGAVYVAFTLAMDIADVPAVASTLERLTWETTVLDELSTVLSTGLDAAQEAAACNGLCGEQLRYIGEDAGSVIVTVQILPVGVAQALLLTVGSTKPNCNTHTMCVCVCVCVCVLTNSRTRWICSRICKQRS
jgi:hypothetical protein